MSYNKLSDKVETLGPIKRQKTLTEQAADEIRNRIVGGQFEFGEALSEIALANELGVSKTPVREAFLQLKNEGLVEILPQRGTFVFRMTIEELRQLSEMREVLEVNSLRFALRDGGETLIESLGPILEGMKAATDIKDPLLYREYDALFHTAIIHASGNRFMESAYNVIALRVQAFRNRLSLDAQNWRSLEQHLAVAELVRSQEVDKAADALRIHIQGAFNDYVARVTGDEADVA
jgi:DNA-binding GntR family transcriptional regulator